MINPEQHPLSCNYNMSYVQTVGALDLLTAHLNYSVLYIDGEFYITTEFSPADNMNDEHQCIGRRVSREMSQHMINVQKPSPEAVMGSISQQYTPLIQIISNLPETRISFHKHTKYIWFRGK